MNGSPVRYQGIDRFEHPPSPWPQPLNPTVKLSCCVVCLVIILSILLMISKLLLSRTEPAIASRDERTIGRSWRCMHKLPRAVQGQLPTYSVLLLRIWTAVNERFGGIDEIGWTLNLNFSPRSGREAEQKPQIHVSNRVAERGMTSLSAG